MPCLCPQDGRSGITQQFAEPAALSLSDDPDRLDRTLRNVGYFILWGGFGCGNGVMHEKSLEKSLETSHAKGEVINDTLQVHRVSRTPSKATFASGIPSPCGTPQLFVWLGIWNRGFSRKTSFITK